MELVEVHPDQLIPQCVIESDVYSKTRYPIVKRDTVLDDQHIDVLKRFLITKVEVSEKLANGHAFSPVPQQDKRSTETEGPKIDSSLSPFLADYHRVVDQYKRMFSQWQSGAALDIQAIQNLLLPLLNQADAYQAEVFLLANQSTEKDYLYHHHVAVSLLSAITAKRSGFDRDWLQISLAAFISDSGMAKLPEGLYRKRGRLSSAEREQLEKHPTFSYHLVERITNLTKEAKLAILQHHEKVNGKGYPLGVKGGQIHPYAKIIAIADAFHAMTSNRFYQNQRAFFAVMKEMNGLAQQHFDQHYLNVFFTCLEDALLGRNVYLSDGRTATLVALEFNALPELLLQIHRTYEVIAIGAKDDLRIQHFIND